MSSNFGVFLTILLSIILCLFPHSNALRLEQQATRGRGQYVSVNSGKYVPDHDKWAYKPDNRGKYVHVHIPYNGGYGPFMNPYEHDGRDYIHDDKKYNDPFNVEVFTDKTPAVYREYGAPLFNSHF